MHRKNEIKKVFTIPNILSILRILLIPAYLIIYIRADSTMDHFLAASILAASCLTDMLDGKIARRYHMVSTTGKILDPLADKLTQLSLMVCLIRKYPSLWIIMILFIIKESFQIIAGYIALQQGSMLKGAQISGKICTTVLFISFILFVLFPALPLQIIHTFIIADAITLLVSFTDYAVIYLRKGSSFQSVKKDHL